MMAYALTANRCTKQPQPSYSQTIKGVTKQVKHRLSKELP